MVESRAFSVRLPVELIERLDGALRPGEKRNGCIRRLLEEALHDGAAHDGVRAVVLGVDERPASPRAASGDESRPAQREGETIVSYRQRLKEWQIARARAAR